MTPLRRWTLGALTACAAMMTSCAALRPISPVAPPRLTLDEATTRPCRLPRLSAPATIAAPTLGDLEAAYVERGSAILACEQARAAAVETLEAEHAHIDRWLDRLDD